MANGGIIGTVNTPTSTTATGVWHQQEQYEAKVTDTWPQRALFTTNSARFNDGSTDYLSRTPSSAGSTTTGTFSFWVKRGNVTQDTYIWTSYADGTNWSAIGINNVDQLYFYAESSGSAVANLKTNRVFRDVSAWYHIVVAVDSTDGTADDRIKIYVNGVQETSFVQRTNPSSSADLGISETVAMEIGRYGSGSAYFDGYFSEFIFVDGQALTPTSFGVTNSDGVWTPIPYSGTFGTNGFNLQFQNAAALGTDSSSNGNTFTVNNLTSIDQSIDYPVVNFATLNPVQAALSSATFSEGNLKSVTAGTSSANFGGGSSIGVSSGKWYFEAKATVGSGSSDRNVIGVTGELSTIADGGAYQGTNSTVQYQSYNGKVVKNEVDQYTGSTYATGDIIRIALDLDNLHVYFGKGGTWQNSGNPESGATGTGAVDLVAISSTTDGFYFVYHGDNSGASGPVSTFEFNFGSPSYSESGGNSDANGYGNFNQSVPSGYYALNTTNLAEYG